MGYWIEVTSGVRWERMMTSGVELRAPNQVKYEGMFEGLLEDDVILHYLTTALTPKKEQQSSIVGFSFCESPPISTAFHIVVKCRGTTNLFKPIHLSKLSKVKKEAGLSKLVKMNMQWYLTRISENDFKSIMRILPKNYSLWNVQSITKTEQ